MKELGPAEFSAATGLSVKALRLYDERGLLLGTHIGDTWILAVAWCVVLAVLGYVFSRRLFDRRAEL